MESRAEENAAANCTSAIDRCEADEPLISFEFRGNLTAFSTPRAVTSSV